MQANQISNSTEADLAVRWSGAGGLSGGPGTQRGQEDVALLLAGAIRKCRSLF